MPFLSPSLSPRARVGRFLLEQMNVNSSAQLGLFRCCSRATNTGEDEVTFSFDYRLFESQINGLDDKI